MTPWGAHASDELGISNITTARPLQAALTSAVTFSAGAALPLVVAASAPIDNLPVWVAATSIFGLALLGAKAGGTPLLRSILRVTLWGGLAMAVTAGVGRLFGVAV